MLDAQRYCPSCNGLLIRDIDSYYCLAHGEVEPKAALTEKRAGSDQIKAAPVPAPAVPAKRRFSHQERKKIFSYLESHTREETEAYFKLTHRSLGQFLRYPKLKTVKTPAPGTDHHQPAPIAWLPLWNEAWADSVKVEYLRTVSNISESKIKGGNTHG